MTTWRRQISGVAEGMANYPEDGTFEEARDAVVAALKKDEAFDELGGGTFTEAIWEMEDATYERAFDEALNDLYDWADEERVWMELLPGTGKS